MRTPSPFFTAWRRRFLRRKEPRTSSGSDMPSWAAMSRVTSRVAVAVSASTEVRKRALRPARFR